MSEWYQRCASCNEYTCPSERGERRCFKCGNDPRPVAERRAQAVWMVGVTIAGVLAAPAIVVALGTLAAAEWVRAR